MRNTKFNLLLALLLSFQAYAQTVSTGGGFENGAGPEKIGVMGGFGARGGVAGQKFLIQREMGEWWKDSEITKKLQLTDEQISRLNQTFFNHRLKLIDYGAEMEKSDLKLQTLLDADVPNEDQVGTQVDQVLGARGKLEREYTMMNLDLRKVLSLSQWKQLKTIREEHGPGPGNVFFYRKLGPGAGPMPPPDGLDGPPLPVPPGD